MNPESGVLDAIAEIERLVQKAQEAYERLLAADESEYDSE